MGMKSGSQRAHKYQGVYRRESTDRKFKGKPDICFDISYKPMERKFGKKSVVSEGYSEKLAADILAERNDRSGTAKNSPNRRPKHPPLKTSLINT
jgi:hypothetical protein